MSINELNTNSKKRYSKVLKLALFATGISGIVAEYVLSTLASYFIGNAILQFTLIMSIMLFSMGIGSRVTKSIDKYLVEIFVLTELVLSLLVSFVAILAYLFFGFTENSWIIIYLMSIFVGLLIGLEIPLATRVNNDFEGLKTNISSILENDYFGSLIGGLFFGFIGLPFLGLTYTPFVLGTLNFVVSFWLFITFKNLMQTQFSRVLYFLYATIGLLIILGAVYARPIILFGEQRKFKDKIVYQKQTKYQKIILTQWNNDYSLYINGNQQLSTFDEFLYHEPMVHPLMGLLNRKKNILILGGGDGCIVRELNQYDQIEKITLVDLDIEMIQLGKNHDVFRNLNKDALIGSKVNIVIADAFNYLDKCNEKFDAIFIDLPDPNNVDINKLYTREFYYLCYNKLNENGAIISQSGSPYYATKAFYCIEKTMRAAGFYTVPLHNQVLTLGEWGWHIGRKHLFSASSIKSLDLSNLKLRWLNNEALYQITSFGKPLVDTTGIKVNTLIEPVLYNYYYKGNWNLF